MTSSSTARPTVSVVDLDALAANFQSARQSIGTEHSYLAVVKADAYGHGAVECSRRLVSEGIDWLGVALPEEGVEIRRAGITARALCLGSFWPGQESLLIDHDITPVVTDLDRLFCLPKLPPKKRGRSTSTSRSTPECTGSASTGDRQRSSLRPVARLARYE